jgi:hypothetical protein
MDKQTYSDRHQKRLEKQIALQVLLANIQYGILTVSLDRFKGQNSEIWSHG